MSQSVEIFGRTFSSVKKEILKYFPYIAAKNLGDKLDPFAGLKDLQVCSNVLPHMHILTHCV